MKRANGAVSNQRQLAALLLSLWLPRHHTSLLATTGRRLLLRYGNMQPQNKYLQVQTDNNAGFHTTVFTIFGEGSFFLQGPSFAEISILYTPYTECIVCRPKVSRTAVLATGDGSWRRGSSRFREVRVAAASGGGVPPPSHHSIHQMELPLKYLHSKNISINRTKIILPTRDSWQDEKSIWQQLYYYVCCIFNSSLKCCFSIYRVWDKNQFQKLFLKQSFITLSRRHKPKAHLIVKYRSQNPYH